MPDYTHTKVAGTKRDKTGHCPGCPDRDTGHTPIGGVPVVPAGWQISTKQEFALFVPVIGVVLRKDGEVRA